jgi:hypothetical protein
MSAGLLKAFDGLFELFETADLDLGVNISADEKMVVTRALSKFNLTISVW